MVPETSSRTPARTSSRRGRRQVVVLVTVLLMTMATVAGGIALLGRRGTPAATTDTSIPVKTAAVVRTDIATTRSLTGTLGFGPAEPLTGSRAGMVTWLPRPGASVERGGQLFRVDDRPVPLFYGAVPIYRDLAQPGTVGRDVRVVATNLRKLGYDIGTQPGPGTPITTKTNPRKSTPLVVRKGEGVLTLTLIAAIRRWQRDAGLPETGRIGVGDVVVRPGAVRVESVTAQRGGSAVAPLMTLTRTARVITVSAAATEVGTIRRGDRVTVTLPGDETVSGQVSAIGTALRSDEAAGPGDQPERSITVTVDDDAGLAGIDAADVRVDFVSETHKDVLAVPVGALVALSEGGYAVQEAGGGLIAVTVGLFERGLVEVSGDGLAEGTPVVTTS